jgi:hypothetical protein
MADVRCREEEDAEIPGELSKLEEDEKMKRRARLNMMTSNAREPWTISTVVRPIP